MDVVAEGRVGVDGLDDLAGKVARMAGGEANAANARDLANGDKQFGEGQLPFRVPVAVDVLAKQLNLGVAEVGDAAGLGKNRGAGPAALLAARIRDHAVGTELVAALDDGDVAAVGVLAGGELGLEGLVGLAVIEAGDSGLPCLEADEHLGQLAVGCRPGDERDVGRALEDLFALLLGDAAEHAKALAGLWSFL